MKIIVIEGLSLVGKTTLCKTLWNHYKELGMNCKYCHHGHLTNDEDSERSYRRALALYNSWNVQDAVRQSILSIQKDFRAYQLTKHLFSEIDIAFLDRHYMSQYVVSQYFGVKTEFDFIKPANYYEFLITSSYKERMRRSIQRCNNHSKLTDFTLKSPYIHEAFEDLYREYALIKEISPDFIFSNDHFDIDDRLISMVNGLN